MYRFCTASDQGGDPWTVALPGYAPFAQSGDTSSLGARWYHQWWAQHGTFSNLTWTLRWLDQDGSRWYQTTNGLSQDQLYWEKGRIVKIQFSVFSFAHFDAFHMLKAQLYCRGTPGWTAMALHLHNLFSPDFQVEVSSLLLKSWNKSADGIYIILYLQYIRCVYIYIISL